MGSDDDLANMPKLSASPNSQGSNGAPFPGGDSVKMNQKRRKSNFLRGAAAAAASIAARTKSIVRTGSSHHRSNSWRKDASGVDNSGRVEVSVVESCAQLQQQQQKQLLTEQKQREQNQTQAHSVSRNDRVANVDASTLNKSDMRAAAAAGILARAEKLGSNNGTGDPVVNGDNKKKDMHGEKSRAIEFEAARSIPSMLGKVNDDAANNPAVSARNKMLAMQMRISRQRQEQAARPLSKSGSMRSHSTAPSTFTDYGKDHAGSAEGDQFNELGRGIKVALDFMSSSDKDVRVRAGQFVSLLLKDCSGSDIHLADSSSSDEGPPSFGRRQSPSSMFSDLTSEEMSALKVLATSRVRSLRDVAGNVLGDFASRGYFPRGSITLQKLLVHATGLLQSNECSLQIFALRIATDMAAKGSIWQLRLLERNWLGMIIQLIQKMLVSSDGKIEDLVPNGAPPSLFPSQSNKRSTYTSPESDTGNGSSEGEMRTSTTCTESPPPRENEGTLQLNDQQRHLLKLAFEFIGTLDLDEAEDSLKRMKKLDLTQRLSEERTQLIDLLTTMCSRCSMIEHSSLIKLLFGAMSGLVKNLSEEQWESDDLSQHFVHSTLNVVLERALEAAKLHQSLTSAILSRLNMQGEADEDSVFFESSNLDSFLDGDDFPDQGAAGFATGLRSRQKVQQQQQQQAQGLSSPDIRLDGARMRHSTLSAFSLGPGVQRVASYRENPKSTDSMVSANSANYSKRTGLPASAIGNAGGLFDIAEAVANESRAAVSQRNAQQSNHMMLRCLHLTAITMEALQVVRCACAHSRVVAEATVDAFELHGVMRVLNMLYRSDVPNAKTAVADFLYAVCDKVCDQSKILLCESGVIVRLIRLASPSSVYGKKGPAGLESSGESAFVPALHAIACLASVDVIGARIILAGGLGPLYSHANSTRQSRPIARKALDALGVNNINDLVDLWTSHRKERHLLRHQGDEAETESGDGSHRGHNLPEPQPFNPGTTKEQPQISRKNHSPIAAGRKVTARAVQSLLGHHHHQSSSPNSPSSIKNASSDAEGNGAQSEASRQMQDNKPNHPAQHRSKRLLQVHSSFNSTREFFQPSPKEMKQPRTKRVEALMSKWRREDGQDLVMAENVLCNAESGDPKWSHGAATLGSGAFSTVYKACIRKDHACLEEPANDGKAGSSSQKGSHSNRSGAEGGLIAVAVKKLTEAAFADDSFLDEIKILSKVPAHRHITNLHCVVFSQNTVLIVSELGGPHTLAWHLVPSNNSPLCSSWVSRLKVLIGIAEALKSLQSMNPAVLHLDLKSSNVLVSDLGNGRFVPKLCDFGLAVELKPGYEFLSPANHGTLQWMSPEVLKDEEVELSKGFDQAADTYSFAVVMWECAHPGRVPWDELAVDVNLDSIQDRIREMVVSGRRLTCYDTAVWPEGYERLMRVCWRHKPPDRPCFVRSFLTDPDSFSWSGPRGKTRDAAQETIGTSLTRILWEVKSAKRVSLGANVSRRPMSRRLSPSGKNKVAAPDLVSPRSDTSGVKRDLPSVENANTSVSLRSLGDFSLDESSSAEALALSPLPGSAAELQLEMERIAREKNLRNELPDGGATANNRDTDGAPRSLSPADTGDQHPGQPLKQGVSHERKRNPNKPLKLRRQSSVLGYGCVDPGLSVALDYHDHDHDFGNVERKGANREDRQQFSHLNFEYPFAAHSVADAAAVATDLSSPTSMACRHNIDDGGSFRRHLSSSIDETSLPSHAARSARILD